MTQGTVADMHDIDQEARLNYPNNDVSSLINILR